MSPHHKRLRRATSWGVKRRSSRLSATCRVLPDNYGENRWSAGDSGPGSVPPNLPRASNVRPAYGSPGCPDRGVHPEPGAPWAETAVITTTFAVRGTNLQPQTGFRLSLGLLNLARRLLLSSLPGPIAAARNTQNTAQSPSTPVRLHSFCACQLSVLASCL